MLVVDLLHLCIQRALDKLMAHNVCEDLPSCVIECFDNESWSAIEFSQDVEPPMITLQKTNLGVISSTGGRADFAEEGILRVSIFSSLPVV